MYGKLPCNGVRLLSSLGVPSLGAKLGRRSYPCSHSSVATATSSGETLLDRHHLLKEIDSAGADGWCTQILPPPKRCTKSAYRAVSRNYGLPQWHAASTCPTAYCYASLLHVQDVTLIDMHSASVARSLLIPHKRPTAESCGRAVALVPPSLAVVS